MSEIVKYNAEEVQLIKDTFCRNSTDLEFEFFLALCRRKNLDPFQRQIHFVKRYDSRLGREVGEVQTGIDGYRLLAERSGRYEGQLGPFWCGADGRWLDVWIADEPPVAAKVGVYKTGCREPFIGIALFKEYVQTYSKQGEIRVSPLWKKMPANQLAKCAEALAIRKAFPGETGGIYTSEEMAQASNPIEVTVLPPAPTPAYTTIQLKELCTELIEYVSLSRVLEGVKNITGHLLASLDDLEQLDPIQVSRIYVAFAPRLEKLKAESPAPHIEPIPADPDEEDLKETSDPEIEQINN